MYKYLVLILFFIFQIPYAQEFKCKVTIDASAVRGSNKQMFKTLEQSVKELINSQKWTDHTFKSHEKIKCDLIINVKSYDPKRNSVESELYFRSYRPVYHSDYETLLLNLVDKNFVFKYKQFENLSFNPDFIDNNLTATIAYYLYIALGHDFDSFKENGGKEYYNIAEKIQKSAAQNNMNGWQARNKGTGKGDLIEALTDPQNNYYHRSIYTYHRWGLDKMADNPKLAKANITSALNYLSKLKNASENSDYLIKIFFDAKADEIAQIFSEGPEVNINYIVNKLESLAPQYSQKWEEIKKSANNKVRPRLNKIPAVIKEK